MLHYVFTLNIFRVTSGTKLAALKHSLKGVCVSECEQLKVVSLNENKVHEQKCQYFNYHEDGSETSGPFHLTKRCC